MNNIDFTILDEYDSDSIESYYNYATVNFEEYENVDMDYFSIHVSR